MNRAAQLARQLANEQESKTGPGIEAARAFDTCQKSWHGALHSDDQLSEIFKTLPELLQWNRQT